MIGCCFPYSNDYNLSYYLSKYGDELLNYISDKDRKDLWEAFMKGYLPMNMCCFYSSSLCLYYDYHFRVSYFYNLMRNHYKKFLDERFLETEYKYNVAIVSKEIIEDHFIKHICIGYLEGYEDLNNSESLFVKMIDKYYKYNNKNNRFSVVEVVINFFAGYIFLKCGDSKECERWKGKVRDRIIDFWRWIYENKYKSIEEGEFTDGDKKILSELCELTVFLPEINSENFEWLKLSVSFLDVRYNLSLFIEYLNNLKDKGESVNFIGKIYLEMLKNTTPYFRRENIQSIVEYLYQKGKKEEADKICNIYAEQGYEFLKPLYEKYNR